MRRMAEPRGDAGAFPITHARRLLCLPLPAAQKLLSALELRMDLGLTQRKRLRLFLSFFSVSNGVSNAGVVEFSVGPAVTSLRPVSLSILSPPVSMDDDYCSDSEAEGAEAGAPRSKARSALALGCRPPLLCWMGVRMRDSAARRSGR